MPATTVSPPLSVVALRGAVNRRWANTVKRCQRRLSVELEQIRPPSEEPEPEPTPRSNGLPTTLEELRRKGTCRQGHSEFTYVRPTRGGWLVVLPAMRGAYKRRLGVFATEEEAALATLAALAEYPAS